MAENSNTDASTLPIRSSSTIEEQVSLLIQASATLLTSVDSDAVFENIVELAARFVAADAYAVWREDEAGRWRAVAARGLSEPYRANEIAANKYTRKALQTPLVIADVEQEDFLAPRQEDFRREGIRALLVIPLRLRGHVGGTITFYYRNVHTATEADVRIATALANLAGAAITTAELYETQSRLRAAAQTAEEQARFLSEATAILASSLDYATTLSSVAQLAVPQFADWCAVDMLTPNGDVECLSVAHVDPAKVAWAKEVRRRYPPNPRAEHGLAHVLRTGEYVLANDIPDEGLTRTAVDAEHLRMLRELGLQSVLMVPLTARGKVLGVLLFVTTGESGRRFGAAEVALSLHIARRAAIAVDNADLYRAAERRRQDAEHAASLLRQANADLQQFAYAASHDLQEPLRMIGIYAQLLTARYKDMLDDDAKTYLGFIDGGAQRLNVMLRDLLEYARLGSSEGGVSVCSSQTALQSALANLQLAISESKAQVISGELPDLTMNHAQLTLVFQNLIANAIKFRRDVPLIVQVDATRGEDEWIFSVHDNATGFDPRHASKIFVLFQRLHGAEYAGTGIGLAVCKRIVEQRGGRIWVESQPGDGSTFFFTVPDRVAHDMPMPEAR